MAVIYTYQIYLLRDESEDSFMALMTTLSNAVLAGTLPRELKSVVPNKFNVDRSLFLLVCVPIS